ncbi:MAG TPA: hypothetical protein VEA59_04595 [Patescibacteria group bacterium]|nr:hypothetical protein [Patescibacteria group bacterium]
MTKKKYLVLAAAPVLGLSLIGAALVSARGGGGPFLMHGGFGFHGFDSPTPDQIVERTRAQFKQEAELLDISEEEVKAAWAQGKGLHELAQEKGITAEQLKAKMQAALDTRLKTNLQVLVDRDIITQAQADQRLQYMQTIKIQGGMGMKKKMMFQPTQ